MTDLVQQAEDEMSSIDLFAVEPLPPLVILTVAGLVAAGIRDLSRDDDPGGEMCLTLGMGRAFLADIHGSFDGFPAIQALLADAIEVAS